MGSSTPVVFLLCIALAVGYTLPNSITFGSNVIPEGFVYLPSYYSMGGQFLVGSFDLNQIVLISNTGVVTPYWALPTGMEGNIIGLVLDVARDRLIVTVAKFYFPQPNVVHSSRGTLWSLSLPSNGTDGTTYPDLDFYIDFGAAFPNDAAVDENGIIYVTDTDKNLIYKVDTLGAWDVLVTDNNLLYRANGIEYGQGYLLVGTEDGLTKVTLNSSLTVQSVQVIDGLNTAYDGIRFDPCKFQLAVSWLPYTFGILESNNNWTTAYTTYEKDTGDTCHNTAAFWADGHFFYNCNQNYLTGQNYTINAVPRIIPHFWNPESKAQLECSKCTRLNKCSRL